MHRRVRTIAGAVAGMSLCACSAAWGQRNGDVSDGLDHQPTQGEVMSRERATGNAPSLGELRREAGTVDTLDRDLMSKERADDKTASPVAGTPSPDDAHPDAVPDPECLP